jgi:hypothetical protein
MECKAAEKKPHCTCTYSCSKKGNCCECVAYHHARNELPGCFFPPAAERSYDRSRQAFMRAWSA